MATSCDGIIPSDGLPGMSTFDPTTDFLVITDTSVSPGERTKQITMKNIFSGSSVGDFDIKNKAPGKFITIYGTNSSMVEIPLIGLQPDNESVVIGGSLRGLRTTISTSSDAFDVRGFILIKADTSGGNVTLGGFANSLDRDILFIYKPNTANTLTIKNNQAAATEKIFTANGSDIVLSNRGGIVLICDGETSWYAISQ